jgi:hypothetical protein
VKHTEQMRQDFDLSQAQYEMNRLDHEVVMLQAELAAEVRRPDGSMHTPLAQELESKIRAKQKELVAAIERVRELKTEKFKNKLPTSTSPKSLIDLMVSIGGYIPRSFG